MSKISVKPYNTFGIDAKAKQIIPIHNIEAAKTIIRETQSNGDAFLLLGGGSNVLFTKDFDGTIILNRIKGIELSEESNSDVILKVGAGEDWHSFVEYAIRQNYGGLENLSLIPGCVGASPMQNIGAYGVEVKDLITKVHTLQLDTLEPVVFENKDCEFGYRTSIFKTSAKNKYLITHVEFRLTKKHSYKIEYGAIQNELEKQGVDHKNLSIKAVSDAVISIRKSKLPNPKEIGNAGSFFKNPVIDETQFKKIQAMHPEIPHYIVNDGIKLAAGWLIEKAGWKGYNEGEFGVHKNQALVLVNYGKAKGHSIYELSERIIKDISNKFEIQLEREVNLI